MTKPIASLSIDLDNKWAYLRTHGVAGWDKYPSYLGIVAPRIEQLCTDRNVLLTCFVVGRDAQRRENREPLNELAYAGHEIANHSLNHYPWLQTLSRDEVEMEICIAEEAIERATGCVPVGFRGPGYSLSEAVLETLVARGYEYDASTLPTFVGPLARLYFHHTATVEAAENADRRTMFGTWSDGLRPNKPYLWHTAGGPLVEIPVTTFPFLKLPIHMTYLWYLEQFSPKLARFYLQSALGLCRWFGVSPSVLLHPLDFLGSEDDPELKFFPGMNLPRAAKMALLDELLTQLAASFRIVTMREHAAAVRAQHGLAAPPARPSQLNELLTQTSVSPVHAAASGQLTV